MWSPRKRQPSPLPHPVSGGGASSSSLDIQEGSGGVASSRREERMMMSCFGLRSSSSSITSSSVSIKSKLWSSSASSNRATPTPTPAPSITRTLYSADNDEYDHPSSSETHASSTSSHSSSTRAERVWNLFPPFRSPSAASTHPTAPSPEATLPLSNPEQEPESKHCPPDTSLTHDGQLKESSNLVLSSSDQAAGLIAAEVAIISPASHDLSLHPSSTSAPSGGTIPTLRSRTVWTPPPPSERLASWGETTSFPETSTFALSSTSKPDYPQSLPTNKSLAVNDQEESKDSVSSGVISDENLKTEPLEESTASGEASVNLDDWDVSTSAAPPFPPSPVSIRRALEPLSLQTTTSPQCEDKASLPSPQISPTSPPSSTSSDATSPQRTFPVSIGIVVTTSATTTTMSTGHNAWAVQKEADSNRLSPTKNDSIDLPLPPRRSSASHSNLTETASNAASDPCLHTSSDPTLKSCPDLLVKAVAIGYTPQPDESSGILAPLPPRRSSFQLVPANDAVTSNGTGESEEAEVDLFRPETAGVGSLGGVRMERNAGAFTGSPYVLDSFETTSDAQDPVSNSSCNPYPNDHFDHTVHDLTDRNPHSTSPTPELFSSSSTSSASPSPPLQDDDENHDNTAYLSRLRLLNSIHKARMKLSRTLPPRPSPLRTLAYKASKTSLASGVSSVPTSPDGYYTSAFGMEYQEGFDSSTGIDYPEGGLEEGVEYETRRWEGEIMDVAEGGIVDEFGFLEEDLGIVAPSLETS
ncbi:hypothetical protein HDU67_007132 [Dinochytrium kinnereticum]|nr:hypothetical protein HDU67_007132 [Dinochytrium kinnereticum]